MTQPDAGVRTSIRAALAMLPAAMDTAEAQVMLIAIGLQESRMIHRRQLVGNPPRPVGPAKGLLQFERLGGCRGVVDHAASRYWMHSVCKALDVQFNATAIWNALETNDMLAFAAGRLLLFTDPKRLPATTDTRGAWNLYIRTWKPGKPHRATWDEFHERAQQVVNAWGSE